MPPGYPGLELEHATSDKTQQSDAWTLVKCCGLLKGLRAARSTFGPPLSRQRSAAAQRARVALRARWDRLRARLDLILDQRGADMAVLPGGASGSLVRDYKGKEADRLVTRIDPGGGLPLVRPVP